MDRNRSTYGLLYSISKPFTAAAVMKLKAKMVFEVRYTAPFNLARVRWPRPNYGSARAYQHGRFSIW